MDNATAITDKTHMYYEDLLPAYALGSLETDEDLLVAEHLSQCADCRVELAAYRSVVAELPLAITEVDPPKDLKAKIMARARMGNTESAIVTKPSLWQSISLALQGLPTLAVASLLLIIVLGISNLALLARLDQTRSADRSKLLTIHLAGTEYSPDATGLLVISQDGEYGTLVVDGLPDLDPSRQYQLWLIQDGERSSGGIFSVGDDGYGSLVVDSNRSLAFYDSFGITIEPVGGSPEPTGDKVLGGQL
jgi:anti-sigma-K factor RskA